MLKKLLVCLCLFIGIEGISQSITVLDNSVPTINGAATPLDITYEYCYSQAIYRNSYIQGSGTITGIKYYFAGPSLSNSDSLLVFIGNTSWNYFDIVNGFRLIPLSRLKKVFKGKVSYSTLPGVVSITFDTAFVYNKDSNLVVGVCDLKAGGEVPVNNAYFVGYYNDIFGSGLSANVTSSLVDLNPMDPAVVEQNPSNYLGGAAGLAKITLVGLVPLPCQAPRNVNIRAIQHNSAKVLWSPPLGSTPAKYDVYYDLSRTAPLRSMAGKASINAPDTQVLINNLQADTMYYVWVRSRCGTADTSLWTYIDSFRTICAPAPIPTVAETFSVTGYNWLPRCWSMAFGDLKPSSTLVFRTDPLALEQPWDNRRWRNVAGSTNYAATGFFVGVVVDSNSAWLITPSYNLGTSGNKSLEFDMAFTKNNSQQQATMDADDKFAVVISTDNGITWSSSNVLQQWTSAQTISAAGQHVVIPLSGYTGFVKIGFYTQSKVYTAPATNLFIDNVQITGVMPVKWISFTGSKEGSSNLLQWRTGSEQNNRGFEVQTSPNGNETFRTIAFVPTQAPGGNSSNALGYTYTDKSPLPGGNYYRLRQMDNDGRYSYSNVVYIAGGDIATLSLATVYPNPASRQMNALVLSPQTQRATLSISDMAGRPVQQSSLQLQKGSNTLPVNVSKLSAGTYLLHLQTTNGSSTTTRWVKVDE